MLIKSYTVGKRLLLRNPLALRTPCLTSLQYPSREVLSPAPAVHFCAVIFASCYIEESYTVELSRRIPNILLLPTHIFVANVVTISLSFLSFFSFCVLHVCGLGCYVRFQEEVYRRTLLSSTARLSTIRRNLLFASQTSVKGITPMHFLYRQKANIGLF